MLSAVSLPGGIQRRRTAEDELQMREIFKEGDIVLVCCSCKFAIIYRKSTYCDPGFFII